MQKYNGALLRKFDDPVQGNASVGTSVVVRKKSDNSIAPIYSVDDINSIQKPNPFTTDAFGRYSFFAPNGKYIIQFGDGSDEIEISMVDNLDHNSLSGRNAAGAHSASSISNANGGSVQDFIDDTESTLTNEGILSPYKNCAQLGKLLADGTTIVIGCTGDSTMYGYDANTGLQNAWNPPASLGIALNLLFGLTITPINYAISGTTLRQMMSGTGGYAVPFSTAVSSGVLSGCDLIYCNHGINDSQLNNSIDQYREDIIEFVRLCRVNNKVPVLVTPNPNIAYVTGYPNALINDDKAKRLLLYVDVMREMSKRLNVDIVDNYYYFSKTFEQVNPVGAVPDGIHMTDAGYRQSGFNMAIPLITANTLYKKGDVSGFYGTTYKDNATLSRNFQATGSPRTGVTFSCQNAISQSEGINFPFILDAPQKVLSLIGLQWADAGKCSLAFNSVSNAQNLYQQKNFGNTSFLDWDAENKIRYQFWAGLNIISILFDIPNTSLGTSMAFSGVYIPDASWSDVRPRDGYVFKPKQLGNYDSIFVENVDLHDGGISWNQVGSFANGCEFTGVNDVAVDTNGDYWSYAGSFPFTATAGTVPSAPTYTLRDIKVFELLDGSNSYVARVIKTSGTIKLQLWRNGAMAQTADIAAGQADGQFNIQMTIEPELVTALVSGAGASIAITEPLPSCYVGTPWKHFLVKPSIQI